MGRISFLAQSIWSSVGFLHVHGISFFRLGEFSSIILLKVFSGPLKSEPSLSLLYLFSLGFVFSMYSGFRGCLELGAFCFLHFVCLLCQCFLWYLMHLRFSLLSLVFCWWCLHLWLLTSFLGILSPGLSPEKVRSKNIVFISGRYKFHWGYKWKIV
jgi:hypothetical protein